MKQGDYHSDMMRFLKRSLVLCAVLTVADAKNTNLDEARSFLEEYNEQATVVFYESTLKSWIYNTNITDYNQQKEIEAGLVTAAFAQEAYKNASLFDETNFPEDIKRQFKFIKDIGSAALDDKAMIEEYNQILSTMMDIYSTSQVCKPNKPSDCYTLDGGLRQVMATSTDYEELKWAWKGFRDVVGVTNKPYYIRYVELSNEIAHANGYPDMGAYWLASYETDTIIDDVYDLYQEILPIYEQLHAYVRRKLSQHYSDEIDIRGRLPANVLGDMWGRFWGQIYNLVVPYPDKPNIDATDEMIKQGYTSQRMFNMSDEFFTSCGLKGVPKEFWDNSMLTKPTDGREVVCHPSAWDLYNSRDFRVKMCTEVRMEDFLVVHHEMGHIQYFLQYKDLPMPFRDAANRAFHEAVGEVMTLSVGTPKHLYEVGLLEENLEDEDVDINFLLKTSLDTIGTLPFSLALEQWRWDVFAGNVSKDKWMQHWWQLKEELVGVKPPVERTEADFEPGAMFHIVIAYPFLGYYIRTIIQFQFHKALCDAAGHTGPLHRCDIYNSKAAGDVLAKMLQMGRSKPWPDAMEAITGQREMSAAAIKEYYAPLLAWLKKTNKENGEYIGWDSGHANVASVFLLAISTFFCGFFTW